LLNHIVMFRRKAEVATAYLFHPLHQALIADLKPCFEWAAVDYTV
jgi:hypothetical protein